MHDKFKQMREVQNKHYYTRSNSTKSKDKQKEKIQNKHHKVEQNKIYG